MRPETKRLLTGLGAGALVVGLTVGITLARAQGIGGGGTPAGINTPHEFVLKFSPEKLTQLFQVLQASDGSFRVVNGLLADLQAQVRSQIPTSSPGDKK